MRKVTSASASSEVDLRLRKFSYSWKTFTGDFFGGLIAALIALPYGLAMATLMGLPPIMGLFTSLLTCPITPQSRSHRGHRHRYRPLHCQSRRGLRPRRCRQDLADCFHLYDDL